jgi:DNA polymerase-3 subunit delta
MEWKAPNLTNALKSPPDKLPPVILVYGEDSGMVRQHIKALAAHVLPDPNDPFASDRVSAADLVATPSALADAAGTISFGGGLRLVRVEDFAPDSSREGITAAVTEAVLAYADAPSPNAVVLVAAPLLEDKSALATKLKKHPNAATLRCFNDRAQDIGQLIDGAVRQSGQTLRADARTFLIESLGRDRGISAAEIDKLMLYTLGKPEITLEDCLMSVAAAPSATVFKLCDAIGHRDARLVDQLLTQLEEEGESLVGVQMRVLSHLRRLLKVKEMLATGVAAPDAAKALRPPVAPFAQGDFLKQVNGLPLPRLRTALTRLEHMTETSRSRAVPADLILRRGLLGLSL